MKIKVRLLFVGAVFCAALAAAGAAAAPPQDAAGTWQTTAAQVTSIREAGNNCFIHVAGAVGLQGTLVGEVALPDVLFISHAPCGSPGQTNAHAKGVFTGTIAGVPATCQVAVQGKISEAGDFTANSVFRQCTSGAHANLKFVGTVIGIAGSGTYAGHVK